MSRDRYLPFFLLILGSAVFLFGTGCQTPEREAVRRQLNEVQNQNSLVRANVEKEVGEVKLAAARQRQEDLKGIQSLQAQIADLAQKMERMKGAAPGVAANVPPPKPSVSKADAEALKAENAKTAARLERIQKTLEKMESALARSQADLEAAKAAALALKSSADSKKPVDRNWKGRNLPLTKFVDTKEKVVDLKTYLGKKTVVLVFMKGFYSQGICFYCTAQTSSLARNAKKFKKLNAKVLIVYPGAKKRIKSFIESVREYDRSDDPRFQLPFEVLLDADLNAVRTLRIDGDLAHPTTFVIDSKGVVQFQYTGRTLKDRPSTDRILNEVKRIGAQKP